MPNTPTELRLPLGPGSTDRGYTLYFKNLDQVPHLLAREGLRPGSCIVVTDHHVSALYLEPLTDVLAGSGWSPLTVELEPGEATKDVPHLQALYDAVLPHGIDRGTPVLALGGGVVGDLAGFAAATLLRGLPLVQIPTSLIAQVDSAIGGKTGINHTAGKNLIGAFHQPRLVCIDTHLLHTLPFREWTSGLAEVVKHALIADPEFFDFLDAHWTEIIDREERPAREMVFRAARVKVGIVAQDERESGLRATLNFGHTFGHALEKVTGFGALTHGEAVALGMRAALHLSHRLKPDFDPDPALALVRRLPVPAPPSTDRIPELIEAARTDKKRTSEGLRYVALDAIGEAVVHSSVPETWIEDAWRSVLED